jgi:DNA-binding CsgD family transcriptional regulator
MAFSFQPDRSSELLVKRARPGAPQLPAGDCEKLLTLGAELYSVGDTAHLPQHFLRGLQALIPHEFGGCHLIEPSRHHIAACYEPQRAPAPAQHKEFWRLAGQHPLNPVLFAHPARAWKLSDVMSRQKFHSTEFYNVLYRPLHVDCELVAALPDTETPEAFFLISLHRRVHDFSERDRCVLNLLLPHVANARRRLCARAKQTADAQGESPLFSEQGPFREWLRSKTAWGLTQRECEVLFWLRQGKTNSEIGRILGIAERTAETHALHIYPKMGVENRYTAIATLNRLAPGHVG